MSAATFALLETKRGKPNKVARSAEQEICDGPHKYDGTVVNNKAVGYVPTEYKREEHEYPKMLYHPKFGLMPTPDPAKFAVGAVTQEQIMNANAAYEKALGQWRRENRTFLVALTAEEEKLPKHEQLKVLADREERLLKKGWLVSPPKPKEAQRFDFASEEI